VVVGVVVGTAAPAFAVAPTVTAVNTLSAAGTFTGPAFGTWQGGVQVQVTGTGFTTTADTTVHFVLGANTFPGTSVNVTSATTLTVVTPDVGSAQAGMVFDILVTNSGGTSGVVAADHWNNSNCTFSVNGGPAQIAGAVLAVTPGASNIGINCAQLPASASHVMALTSPVLAAQPPGPICIACDESFIMNNSAGLPPTVTSSATGTLTLTLPIPQKTAGGNPSAAGSATDGDGVSPVTQYQVNQGLQADAFAVANLGGVNFGNALLEYPGQPAPQVPTLALSSQSSTVAAGTTVTATGTGWWGIGTGNNTIPAANVHVGGVAATTANLTVSPPEYGIACNTAAAGNGGACTGTLTPTTLHGTFVVPAGAANNTVTIDQPNTPPTPCVAPAPVCFVGNGPGGTVEGTATLAGVPQATATATGYAVWNNNIENNAVTNSVNPPDPNVWWQPTSAIGANPVTYDVNLGAATTVSAVTADWHPAFNPPTAYTIATSPDGVTFTPQATVTGNTTRVRTDVFTGGAVSLVTHLRLTITAYDGAGGDPYAHLALRQLAWDGHGAVFPRATGGCTVIAANCTPNTTVWQKNVPNLAITNAQDPNVFWQPTSASAASGAIYEVDLGSSQTVSSVSTTWHRSFAPPSAYTIDTSPNGIAWTTRVTVTGNTDRQKTDVFPGGQVSANYVRLVLTTFPFSGGGDPDLYAGVALVQFNVNGAESMGVGRGVIDGVTTASSPTVTSATANFTLNDVGAVIAGPNGKIPVPAYIGQVNSPTSINMSSSPTANIPLSTGAGGAGTGESLEIESVPGATPVGCAQLVSCASSLFPQAYYPAFVGTTTTPNTTTTYNNEVANNAFSGGNDAGGTAPVPRRIIAGNSTCCSVTSGSTTITSAATTTFTTADVGRPVSGVGVAIGAIVTAETGGNTITVSLPSTATNTAVSLSFGGTSWWQPVGNATQAGNPQVFAVDFGTPRSVSNVTAHWLDSTKCPGGAGITCTGFEATAYTILTSPDGVTWTTCATVTANASFTVTDTCSASGVQYLEYDITAWNAPTPYQGYGPALNSLIIS
jgi:hypothetical protein